MWDSLLYCTCDASNPLHSGLVWLSFLTKEIERKLKYIYVLKSSQEKMLTLVVSLALCRQCVGNSEGLANLDNSQQRIGGSKRNSEDFVNAKLHQQNVEDSGLSMEKLLEVVEVKIFQNDLLMFNFRMINRFNYLSF